MDQAAITEYITGTFAGVNVVVGSKEAGSPEVASGDSFFIYDPDRDLPAKHRFPFATIVTKDYPGFDEASKLDRPGVFRLNVGVGKETFRSMFGESVGAEHDVAELDRIMPHPVYGRQYWVCVPNPSEGTFERMRPLLAEAYELSARRLGKGRSVNEA